MGWLLPKNTKKLKINYKVQNKTWTNPHIKNHKEPFTNTNHPKHNTLSPEHMYLKSSTLLT